MKAIARLFNYFYKQDYFWLRLICLLACIPSAGALLLKVYGVMEMQHAVIYIFLPCAVFLLVVWLKSAGSGFSQVGDALFLGGIAGLVASFAYDLIRIPFLLLGQRVFMSIDTYGVWIMNATSSTGLTDVVGWAYHYSNGITFGIIYALFMRGRHYGWAILYAVVLESINLISPFMEIFSLSSNSAAIGILYLGHVAYGIPLGLMTQHWDQTLCWIKRTSVPMKATALTIGLLWLLLEAVSPERIEWDGHAIDGELVVGLDRLNPEFIRLKDIGDVRLSNLSQSNVLIRNQTTNEEHAVNARGEKMITFSEPGIYQLYIKNDRRSYSSFAIVEPVHMVVAK